MISLFSSRLQLSFLYVLVHFYVITVMLLVEWVKSWNVSVFMCTWSVCVRVFVCVLLSVVLVLGSWIMSFVFHHLDLLLHHIGWGAWATALSFYCFYDTLLLLLFY